MAVLSYNLRIQKEIERRLFLDVLSFVDRLWPIRDAVYIGMGSVYFEDFKAMHDRFGVGRMICLEHTEWLQRRQEFNLPLSPSCIELPRKSADDFISSHNFESEPRNVVWLDFEGLYPIQHLGTFASLLGCLQVGDVAKITLDVSYAKLKKSAQHKAQHKAGNRLVTPAEISSMVNTVTREKLGDYFPEHRAEDVDRWLEQKNLGRVLMEAAIVAYTKAVVPGLQFSPLATFMYSDGAEMLTITGIISKMEDDMIQKLEMEKFPFAYRNDDDPYHIAPLPIMTPREKMAVDQRLPLSNKEHAARAHKTLLTQGVQFDECREESLKLLIKYAELYRYHPDYRKINP